MLQSSRILRHYTVLVLFSRYELLPGFLGLAKLKSTLVAAEAEVAAEAVEEQFLGSGHSLPFCGYSFFFRARLPKQNMVLKFH